MDLKNKELEATNKKAQQAIDDANEKAKKAIEKKMEEADKRIEEAQNKVAQAKLGEINSKTSSDAAPSADSGSIQSLKDELKVIKDTVDNLANNRRKDAEKQASALAEAQNAKD